VSFRNGSGLKAAVTVLEARKNVGISNAASSKPPPDNSQVIRVTLTGACANAMPKQGVNRDADGALLARIESNAGRHRLTHPRARPVFSWPILAEAKHRAESLALAATPSNLSALQMGRRRTRAVDRRGFFARSKDR
jgi:hypothetical protein